MSISVGFFYRVLPSYRLAIMEELARQPGIDLTVYYSPEPRYYSLKSADPGDRFKSRKIAMRAWKVGNQEFLYQPETKRIVESCTHDVVVLPGNPRLLSNFPALRAAKMKRVGVAWWSLGIMPNQWRATLCARRLLMSVPDALIFYTQAERDFFVSQGISGERVFVAQNTISVKDEREAAAKWSDDAIITFGRENGLSGKKVFLFCGQLREKKRFDWLLSALRSVLADRDGYCLLVIGPDPTGGKHARLASQMGLNDAVRFLGPIYRPDQLAPWFLCARALVVPRAIGLAALHGFGFNLPCITSRDRRHQTPEAAALRDRYNSLMYEDANIGDLSAKIIELGEDDDLQRTLSANARRTMEEEYTIDKMVKGFVQAIRYADKRARRN